MDDKNAPLRYILLVVIVLTILAVTIGLLLSRV
jgi:hypothetical protein